MAFKNNLRRVISQFGTIFVFVWAATLILSNEMLTKMNPYLNANWIVNLISAGVLIVLVTLFTDAFYEKTLPLLGGIAAFLIGLWLRNKSRQQHGTHVHLHGGRRRRGFPWSAI